MWTEEQIHNRWTTAKFPCTLLKTGLGPLQRANRDRPEVARVGRLRPGAMTVTLGRSTLVLDRKEVEILEIPLRNISSVRVRPVSVDAQLMTLLLGAFRVSAWFGVGKAAFLVFSLIIMIDEPQVQLPRLAANLPYLLNSLAISGVVGLFLHVPFRFVPGLWRIEGRLWRARIETMDGHAFNLMLRRDHLDRIVPLLREAGLVVYVKEGRATLLDRGWAFRGLVMARCRRFVGEIF